MCKRPRSRTACQPHHDRLLRRSQLVYRPAAPLPESFRQAENRRSGVTATGCSYREDRRSVCNTFPRQQLPSRVYPPCLLISQPTVIQVSPTLTLPLTEGPGEWLRLHRTSSFWIAQTTRRNRVCLNSRLDRKASHRSTARSKSLAPIPSTPTACSFAADRSIETAPSTKTSPAARLNARPGFFVRGLSFPHQWGRGQKATETSSGCPAVTSSFSILTT